jgi:outer membrane protein W
MRINLIVILVALFSTIMMTDERMSYADDSNTISIGYGSQTPTPTNPYWQPPSALTIKVKPKTSNKFKPYLGTGLGYSLPSQDIPHATNTDIKSGVAGSAGFSYGVGKNSSLNVDYKYLYLAPDAKLMREGENPQLLGIGFDLKF